VGVLAGNVFGGVGGITVESAGSEVAGIGELLSGINGTTAGSDDPG
jgi:hypothetical protein